MTVFTTDFSEYTSGVTLPDWTDFFAYGTNDFVAQANSGDAYYME